MIPLLYQLSYTAAVKNFRRIRYCIGAFLSRETDGVFRAVAPSEANGSYSLNLVSSF